MARVVPSVVVNIIDLFWPRPKDDDISKRESGQIAGVLDLVYQIPDELLPHTPTEYAELVIARAHIKHQLEAWASDPREPGWLGQIPGLNNRRPVNVIRDALANCDDSFPSAGTAELNFITDKSLRESLRIDISDVGRALASAEWKAATVLAGSAIEALLLWDLQNRHAAETPAAVAKLVTNGTFKAPPANLENWTLQHLTEVTAHLGAIIPETATEVRLAKDFRNLIHPGRAQRLGQKCDRGTAHASFAALDHVVRDLK
jgi:hypothetical protein